MDAIINAKTDVIAKGHRKPSMTLWTTHPDLDSCYKAMVRQVTWFTEQGFTAKIQVGELHGLSQLKKAARPAQEQEQE